ncbi:MAG: molybdopterin biosynthesis protein [Sulfolobales archaeon]
MSFRDSTSAAKVFHKLVTVDEALKELDEYLTSRQLTVEEVDLHHAWGRVLAEDITAVSDYPPFDRSEVDGFAVRSSDLEGVDEDNPVKLKILGSVSVGEQPKFSVEPGTCVEVSTGAMVPRGADAVVPVEHTKRVGDYVYVYRSVAPGENVTHGGSDVVSGDVVALEGTLLGSAELVTLAGTGVSRVKVYRKIKVGVVSIGSELVEPGKQLKPGEVYDANSYYMGAALRELGAEVVFYGIVEDREDRLREVLRKAISECDVVITSGGTSAGAGDITYRVVDELGKPGVIVHGLKVRPGKPTFIALIGNKLLFGLPGFPLSMMMVFNILVKPVVARLLGLRGSYFTYSEEAVLAERVAGYLGVDRLVPVVLRIRRGTEGMLAFPIGYRSGSINTLLLADGFIRVKAGVPYIESGTKVLVYRLNNRKITDVLAVGSHDYLLTDVLKALSREFTVKYVAAGSLAGLDAVAKGVADIAGVHILDSETGTYNEEVIRRFGYGDRVALIVGYMREIGLVTLKGNPKNIKDLRDLLRDDVIFINRSRYSGTRVLLDIALRNLAKELGLSFDELVNKIKGYHSEAKTHSGVAISILTGRADVGLTLRYVAQKYDLEFVPLAFERFDIAVGVDSLEAPGIRQLINYLKSNEFRQLISKYPGYKLLSNTGELKFLR